MARVLRRSAGNVTPKGQPGRMTCWLTAYEMLFNSGGMHAATQYDIERRLNNGGFNVAAAKGGASATKILSPSRKFWEPERYYPISSAAPAG